MRLIISRENDMFPDSLVLITAEVNKEAITNHDELLMELNAGVTKWVKQTKEGREAWDDSVLDFNIGDLMGYDLAPILKNCPNILRLYIERIDVAENWMFDTILVDSQEIEEGSY
jgi:hypothetical protein